MYGSGIGAIGFRRKRAGSGAIATPPPEAPNITAGLKFTPAETVPVSTTIGIVTLVSGVANDFAIVSGNVGSVFAINNVGVLVNVSTLDYESITGYSLEVKASGTGGTNNKSVLVCVTDVLDIFPANSILVESSTSWLITQGGSVIKTGGPAANVITPGQQAQATEHDRNGTTVLNVAYTGSPATSATIASGNTGNVFNVSATGGTVVLYNVSATDFETTPVYTLGLKLENAGGYSAIVTASISIANITEPTINASQAFTANSSDANGTTYVTVAYSGATPHNFSIDGSGLAITSAGVISKTGTITAGNYAVQALMNGYTSPSVNVAVSVSAAPSSTFSAETGDNIVVGVGAWASTTALGSSITMGSITGWFRTNAGKLYYAATGGTTGSTAPTHTSGTASDGSITWEYVCPVDYTSLSSWEAAIPGTLVADVVGIVWADAEYTASVTNLFIINSRTVGSYTITLKAKEELAWYSHASPVGRYDASKGIALRNTDSSYGRGIRVECAAVRIKGLQIKCASTTQDRAAITEGLGGSPGYDSIYDRLILASGGEVAFIRGLLRNSYVIKDSANTANDAVNLYNGDIAAGCVIARPSNNTAGGAAVHGHYSGGTLINCAVMGFTVAPTGTVVATYTASDNATSIPSGTGNITVSFNTTHIVQPSAASALDLRIPSGSSLKNAGTTDTTHIPDSKDAFGTTRSGTWDIGPHEVG